MMNIQSKWFAAAAVALLAAGIAPSPATATNAWFGGGWYDGYDGARALGVPGYPQVHNADGATNVTDTAATLTGMLISTGPGAGVGITTAGLHVELTAGLEAEVWVDWGPADWGQSPVETNTVDMGVRTLAGTPDVPNPYRQRIEGLTASTTYAYRIRAENEYDTAESAWVWFVTHPSDFLTTIDQAWFGGGYYDGYAWNEGLRILKRLLRGSLFILR